jgi:hypothetical protein
MSLKDKIRQGRVLKLKFEHMTFHCKRPTYEQVGQCFAQEASDAEVARRFVVGWEGVRESDLLKGEPDTEVAFDRELFELASGDMKDAMIFLGKELLTAAMKYHGVEEDLLKN